MKSLIESINESRIREHKTTWEKLLYALREANNVDAPYLDPKNIGKILQETFANSQHADSSYIKKYSTKVYRSIMKDVVVTEEQQGDSWQYTVVKGAPDDGWIFLVENKLNI